MTELLRCDAFAVRFCFAVSSYLVTFMRMITSAQIRSNPDEYEAFLTHPDTDETIGVTEFCESVVEVLGKEAGWLFPPKLLIN